MSGFTNLPVSLPKDPLPSHTDIPQLEQKFATILNSDIPLEPYLVSDAVWRDSYALTGTLRTFYGNHNISNTWQNINVETKFHSFKPTTLSKKVQLPGGASWVDIYYEFETAGVPKLQCTIGLSLVYSKLNENSPEGTWKIWVIKSVLDQIKNAPNVDILEPSNALCAENHAPLSSLSGQHFDCVIVGGGQAGLSTAGYCQALGLSYMIIEKNREIGDNWAKRYSSARIHTIREYAHLPFERTFGPEYTEFLGKDDLAAAYKSWCRRYNIRVSLSTVLESGSWDSGSNEWTLNLRHADGSDSELVSLKSGFVVMAVGAGGQVPVLPDLPGRNNFKGTVLHSEQYDTPNAWTGKHGIVVGSANTAHDVAEDMIAAGLDSTTMVQRNRTFVLPVEWYKSIQDKVYNANIPTTISDKLSFIGPHGVQRLTSMTVIHSFACRDSERFEALEKAGFRVDAFGDPYWHIVERLGGHYMDVGASAKISQGLIKMKSDAQLTHYTPTGLGFSDGSELPADLVIFATGFDLNIQNQVEKLFGKDIADQVGPFNVVDSEGELQGAWRFNHPGLVCNGGSMGPCRWYGRLIALYIKAATLRTPLRRDITGGIV